MKKSPQHHHFSIFGTPHAPASRPPRHALPWTTTTTTTPPPGRARRVACVPERLEAALRRQDPEVEAALRSREVRRLEMPGGRGWKRWGPGLGVGVVWREDWRTGG